MDLDSFASMLASQMNRPAVPIRQQLDTLKRLGIRLTPEQEDGFLSQSARYEDPAYAAILTELEAADSDQVYAFDAEVTQRSTMYRDLIGALLRLTGGELDLQDVRESGENADLEGPGGTWRVSFTLNGHPYQYDADFLGDWLDVNVLAFLRWTTSTSREWWFFSEPRSGADFSVRERSSPSRAAERTRGGERLRGSFL